MQEDKQNKKHETSVYDTNSLKNLYTCFLSKLRAVQKLKEKRKNCT